MIYTQNGCKQPPLAAVLHIETTHKELLIMNYAL